MTDEQQRAGVYLKLASGNAKPDVFYLQRAACLTWCRHQGYEVVASREVYGSSVKKRVQVRRELIEMAERGELDVIVVGDTDRWFSGAADVDVEDFERLLSAGVRVEWSEPLCEKYDLHYLREDPYA